jgi:hypothetical protein
MIFNIPIQISVDSTNEFKGEQAIFDFLKAATKEFGNEFRIKDWEYNLEANGKSCCGGCRDLDI